MPRIDCVFFADPKGSTIEIVQAAGRALRLAPGKTRGHILLPLVVPDGATLDEVTATSAYKFVLFVLRALAAHDERIIEWFRATAEGRTPEVGGLIDFDFAKVVAPLGVNAEEFASQIEVRCWDSLAKLSFAPYDRAQIWARKLGITSGRAWGIAYRKLTKLGEWPADIPRAVDRFYRGLGWVDWPTFLGRGRKYVSYVKGKAGRKLRPFIEAREWARTLRLKSLDGWMAFVRENEANLPSDIPSWPDRSYKGSGWVGWPDFLGYTDKWRSFDEAQEFARALKFKGQRGWKEYAKGARPDLPTKPADIPAAPWKAYENSGWISWPDWLGTTKPPRETSSVKGAAKPRASRHHTQTGRFRDFESARAFAHSLQLKSSTEWYAYVKKLRSDKGAKPEDIPSSPHNVYRTQWVSWGDWIGRPENVAPFRKQFRTFEEARAFARTLGLKNCSAWKAWSRTPGNRPTDIPSGPDKVYRDQGFTTYRDFLQPSPDAPAPSL